MADPPITDLAGLADRMDELSKVVAFNAKRAVVGAANDASFTAVLETRVLTGRARGGWNASIEASIAGSQERRDKTGPTTIGRIRRVTSRFRPGQRLFITNAVPYIEILNSKDDMLGKSVSSALSFLRRFEFLQGF